MMGRRSQIWKQELVHENVSDSRYSDATSPRFVEILRSPEAPVRSLLSGPLSHSWSGLRYQLGHLSLSIGTSGRFRLPFSSCTEPLNECRSPPITDWSTDRLNTRMLLFLTIFWFTLPAAPNETTQRWQITEQASRTDLTREGRSAVSPCACLY